ncbi:MAG: metallophosphoesterase [Vicinamibacterales bacterium]
MSDGDATPPAAPPSPAAPDAAIPIARRLAASPVFFPLWLRGRPGPDARMPMVGWFDPGQLVSTGLKSLVSLLVGEQSDRRIVQALASRRQEYYDHAVHYRDHARGPQPLKESPRSELWIDFVCDTGDGWNSTYAVAYAAAQPTLRVRDGATTHDLPRGDVLVFGGDEVYPTPSREEYQRRLVAPYTAAFGDDAPAERPHLYAVPGNHDWYDGLSAFTRLFCSDIGGRRLAGWWTRQRRSYFVLKLPHRWWMVASDGQLQSDLDVPQMEHFRELAERYMQPGDKVILCLSLPVWVYAQKYRNMGRVFDETDLIYLREEVFAKRGVDVKVYLTGDLHHYRRHEETRASAGAAEPVQKITAGGGGAFLHPTHEEDVSVLREEPITDDVAARTFEAKTVYPSTAQSARLAWGNLGFLFEPALRRGAGHDLPDDGVARWRRRRRRGTEQPVAGAHRHACRPSARIRVSPCGAARSCSAFSPSPTRTAASTACSAGCSTPAHLSATFYLGWGTLDLATRRAAHARRRACGAGRRRHLRRRLDRRLGADGPASLISVNVFGRHSEEAFSALRIEDCKHSSVCTSARTAGSPSGRSASSLCRAAGATALPATPRRRASCPTSRSPPS